MMSPFSQQHKSFLQRAFSLLLLLPCLSSWGIDGNGDGLDDAWASRYGIAPFTGTLDPDADGRPNLIESINWSNPNDSTHPDTAWGAVMIHDTNGDQLDDSWYTTHVVKGALLTYEDPDQDGRSNFEESLVGTDPFKVDSPWQQLAMPLTATGPEFFTLSFQSHVTGGYVIQSSTDMENWQDDRLVWGDGSVKTVQVPTHSAPRKFYRIELRNIGNEDPDQDGLTTWQELFVTHTDPNNENTDGQGLSDGQEMLTGTDPTTADPLPPSLAALDTCDIILHESKTYSHGFQWLNSSVVSANDLVYPGIEASNDGWLDGSYSISDIQFVVPSEQSEKREFLFRLVKSPYPADLLQPTTFATITVTVPADSSVAYITYNGDLDTSAVSIVGSRMLLAPSAGTSIRLQRVGYCEILVETCAVAGHSGASSHTFYEVDPNTDAWIYYSGRATPQIIRTRYLNTPNSAGWALNDYSMDSRASTFSLVPDAEDGASWFAYTASRLSVFEHDGLDRSLLLPPRNYLAIRKTKQGAMLEDTVLANVKVSFPQKNAPALYELQLNSNCLPDEVALVNGFLKLGLEDPIVSNQQFGHNYEVYLEPVKIASRDRAIEGFIPNVDSTKVMKLSFSCAGKDYGTYEIPQTGSSDAAHVYPSSNDIFSDEEIDQYHSGSLPLNNWKQEVVLVRDSRPSLGNSNTTGISFYTVSDSLGEFTVTLYADDQKLCEIKHQLTKDEEFARLIAAAASFVSGIDPPGIGSEPTPIFTDAAKPPTWNDGQVQQFLSLVPFFLQQNFPHQASFTFSAEQGIYSTEEINAKTQALETSYAEAFLVWLHEVKETLPEGQWTQISAYLSGVGYNADSAMGSRLVGWTAGQLADPVNLVPAIIQNRALVAKVILPFITNTVKIGIAGATGYIYGIWDGLKTDWQIIEGAVAMPQAMINALQNPYTAASELYQSIKAIKDMTLDQWKMSAEKMFSEFLIDQDARLDWPIPTTVEEAGVSLQAWMTYMAGYLHGFVAEQVVIILVTRGALAQVKAGKWFFTIIDKVKKAQRLFDAMPPRTSRLAVLFPHAMASTATQQIMLRVYRAVPKKLRSTIIPDGKDYSSELHYHKSTARRRLDKALGGVVYDNLDAHHLIPFEWKEEEIVKKASRAGFNINGKQNGALLAPLKHQEVYFHPKYNKAVKEHLDRLWEEAKNLSDSEAATLLLNFSEWLDDSINHATNGLTSIDKVVYKFGCQV